jgi:uncharacterized Zn finger protein
MPKDNDPGWWRNRYPESGGPREAPGGIKAHSKRGQFGQSWWARRWLSVLERLDLGGRLSRGRAYARKGQVLDIAIEEGSVSASVQGSREDPYAVSIRVDVLPPATWRKVGRRLGREARFAAKLLAGEMPADVEEAFTAAGASLFPASRAELRTECSCPDWSNPCKHIAAVYYLLGEEFDRDPFLVFRLRGLSREGLQALLADSPVRPSAPSPAATPEAAMPAPDPMTADTTAFWSGGELPPLDDVRIPDPPPALLTRAGPFPFWRGAVPVAAALEGAYVRASLRALDVYLGLGGRQDKPGR